jgi:elongation factor G
MSRNTRTFGIVAHVDAGKTTTTEQVLFLSGKKHRAGTVGAGTTTTDFLRLEQERGITIQAAAVTCRWEADGAQADLNLIDTPGHIDFTAEVIRSLRVLDGAVVVLSARNGVQPNTPRVWKYADRYQVPRLVFVNKMDATGADFRRTVEQVRTQLKASPAVIQLPLGEQGAFRGVVDVIDRRALVWGSEENGEAFTVEDVPAEMREAVERARLALVEQLAEEDTALMGRYLEGQEITSEEIRAALRNATVARKLFPVLCGSAQQQKGIEPLLDAVVRYLPSPLERPPVVGHAPDGREALRRASDLEPLCALAFKTVEGPHGALTFVRVYSGVLRPGTQALNPRTGLQRVGRLLRIHGKESVPVEELRAGDIGAILGLKDAVTGDTLCARGSPIVLESIVLPEPVLSLTIEPVETRDLQRLVKGLHELARDDPSFRFRLDEESGQALISGLGELHLEVKRELLREAGLQTRAGNPAVSYRETIQRRSHHRHTLKMQNGGRGLYAEVAFDVAPLPAGGGFAFESVVTGGAIPPAFIKAVEAGMREALSSGPLQGYPVTDVKVVLRDGRTHEKDSSELAFKLAGARALSEALSQAGPILLEPIMALEVEVPPASVGSVIGDVLQRRGRLTGKDNAEEGSVVLRARVPLVETFARPGKPGYATALRNATQGKGLLSLTPLCYERAPAPRD